jgi:hypothetical protein
MNATEADRDLQRLFASYDPVINEEPFLEHAFAALNRELRRARMRSALIYALSAMLIVALAAATAAPLNAGVSVLEKSLRSLAGSFSPLKSQALTYAATLGLLALARRRLRAFLAPW